MSSGDGGGIWDISGGASIDANGMVDATGLLPGEYMVTYTIINPDVSGLDCLDAMAFAMLSVVDCPFIPTCFDGMLNGDETGIDCGGSCPPCDITLQAIVFLEGPFPGTGSMNIDLIQLDLIPSGQPFNIPPFNYGGTEFNNSIPANVVDWVFVQLREPGNWNNVVAEAPALLRNDGTLLGVDGLTGVLFEGVPPGNYRVSIFHKGHQAIMSSIDVSLPNGTPYDFSASQVNSQGSNQVKLKGGRYCMKAGDFDFNGLIENTDFDLFILQPAELFQYRNQDANCNGLINNHDFNLFINNEGSQAINELQY